MEGIRNIANHARKLPKPAQISSISSFDPKIRDAYSNLISACYDDLINPMGNFLQPDNHHDTPQLLAWSMQKLDDLIEQYQNDTEAALSDAPSQHVHPNAAKQQSMNLLPRSDGAADVVLILRDVLQQKAYPLFTPYMSTFPFIDKVEALKIMDVHEGDLLQFAGLPVKENVYAGYIRQTTQAGLSQGQWSQTPRDDEMSHQFTMLNNVLDTYQAKFLENEDLGMLRRYLEKISIWDVMDNIGTYKDEQQQILLGYVLQNIQPAVITTEEALDQLIGTSLKGADKIVLSVNTTEKQYYPQVSYMLVIAHGQFFIVDALELRAHMHKLREVLVDRNIVKIVYDSQNISYLLQHNFRLYLNNVADTKLLYEILFNKQSANQHDIVQDVLQIRLYQSLYTQFTLGRTDFALRPLTQAQTRAILLDGITTRQCALQQAMAIIKNPQQVDQYDSVAKQLLLVNAQEVIRNQNQQLFSAVFGATDQKLLYIGIFNLFIDIIARTTNMNSNSLFSFANAEHDSNGDFVAIRQILRREYHNWPPGIFRTYCSQTNMAGLESVMRNYTQMLSQQGNFNKQTSSCRESKKRALCVRHQPLDLGQLCAALGWEAPTAAAAPGVRTAPPVQGPPTASTDRGELQSVLGPFLKNTH